MQFVSDMSQEDRHRHTDTDRHTQKQTNRQTHTDTQNTAKYYTTHRKMSRFVGDILQTNTNP